MSHLIRLILAERFFVRFKESSEVRIGDTDKLIFAGNGEKTPAPYGLVISGRPKPEWLQPIPRIVFHPYQFRIASPIDKQN